ncbi:MAG: fused MFS/spermidine synthase [Candidatus Sumerlaeia bacterium]|nr:fused MFS/spermidine synthase [Candidatus Sumerlaeia bacterium]
MRKFILYLIVFVSGAVVLALEILAGRFLNVKFGSSVHVWGNLIAVFLAGLSLGYFLGGHLSDRKTSFAAFGSLLLLSAILLIALRFYAFPIRDMLHRRLEVEVVETVGPLVASLAIFFIPTVVLGMVSPYAVRLLADDPARLGRQVGALYAFSTAGSIVGALGTTFYLISHITVPRQFILFGAIQAVLALLAFSQAAFGKAAAQSRSVAKEEG